MRRAQGAAVALAACMAAIAGGAAALPAGAEAAIPPSLWTRCDAGIEDTACNLPRGLASDRVSGDLYVSDQSNHRILQYTAWGEFRRAWGWGVLDGAEEAQVCIAVEECMAGISGEGPGQLDNPQGIAVDSTSAVYAYEVSNRRVQKFDSEGDFVLMFGGEVNKTKSEEGGSTEAERNLCTAASGDECQAGTTGTGDGQFSSAGTPTASVAIGSADKVYVGDKGRIQVFDSGGHYLEDLPDPEGKLGPSTVKALASGPANSLFVALVSKAGVHRLNATTGATICTAEAQSPTAVAGDNLTNLFVIDSGGTTRIRQYSATCEDREEPFGEGEITNSTGLAAGKACFAKFSEVGVYASNISPNFVRAYGPPPSKEGLCPKPKRPPFIAAQYALSVSSLSAVLRAEINPRFWADASYWVQYGTQACLAAEDWEAPCVKEKPVPPGTPLGAGIADEPRPGAGVLLGGLEPNTAYAFRFGAQSEGGGPVFGAAGAEGEDGPAGAFHTLPLPSPPGVDSCPNAAQRSGPGALLPDCRAYEMVSPVDKAGGDIVPLVTSIGRRARLDQSAASGDGLAYSAFRAFGDAQSEPFSPQYIARREAGVGWSTEAISPPRGVQLVGSIAENDTEYKAFSEDLCTGWLVRDRTTELPFASGSLPGAFSLYRNSLCGGDRAFLGGGALKFGAAPLELQGLSADGSHAIFRTAEHLTQDAAVAVGTKARCLTPTFAETISYRWLREGEPIGGASNAEYTLGPEDAGKAVQCQVTATNSDAGATQVANPAWVAAPYPALEPPRAPLQLPAPEADAPLGVGGPGGQTLSCDPQAGAWEGAPGFEYRWYRNGKAIAGAEEAQYTVSAEDLEAPAAFQCLVKGTGAGGTVAIASENALSSPSPSEPAAPVLRARSEGTGFDTALYESEEGELRSVCLPEAAPGERTLANLCSAGSASGSFNDSRSMALDGAISADGETIFWSDATNGTGHIFARLGGGETIAVSQAVSNASAQFWKGARDGSAVLFSIGSELYRFDLPSAEATPLASGFSGLMGASEDLARIYLASEEVLSEAGEASENEAGQTASEGEPNLYLLEGGEFTFIGLLSEGDASASGLSPVSREPYNHLSRVTPDGAVAAFMSSGSPTGYDNTDAESGQPAAEVYRYEAGSEELACVSCDPGGARPKGRNLSKGVDPYWAAAQIPGAENQLYAPRALSEDGSRLFFESFEALVLRDTNNRQDVYQWEAPGKGSCTPSAPAYSPPAKGCVALLSSGEGTQDSEFVDADLSGENAFIRIPDSLVTQDPGQFDIYDARVGGGLPQPAPEPAPCEGEACQNAPPPPEARTPASASFQGAGNITRGCAAPARQARRLSARARRAARRARRAARAGNPGATKRTRRRARGLAKQAKRKGRAARRCRARAKRRASR